MAWDLVSSFLVAAKEGPDRRNVRKGGFVLAHGVRGTVRHDGKGGVVTVAPAWAGAV